MPFPRGPLRLAQLAVHALAWAEKSLEAAWAWGAPQNLAPTCRRGCAACCRQVIPVSAPEAFLLAENAENLPVTERSALLGRFQGAVGTLAAAGLADAPILSEAVAYFRLQLPCPYLVRETCTIHALRPLACREHNMVSAPEHCWDFPHPAQRAFPLAVSFSAVLAEVTAELLGGPPEWIPLVRALAWAAENKETAERVWEGDQVREKLLQKLERYGVAGR